MGEAQELQLQIMGQEAEKTTQKAEETNDTNQPTFPKKKSKWWLARIFIYTFFLLVGQTVATILGRLYFDRGGNSKWMATFVQTADDSTESKKISKGEYVIGYICTVTASAGYALMLSSTQFCFKKVFKQENFKIVLDMIFYPSIVATLAILVGLFASGEWKGLKKDMEGFELGNVSYLMTLIWTAINWQVFSIGCTGLIFEVSSLFSNVISTLGLPIVPVLAVFIFHDKMDGLKVIAMVLAMWGFLSYIYQHYLDDYKSKTGASILNDTVKEEVSQDSTIQRKLVQE
ncbi:hypothetical protein JCGZ_04576 [Jatropha curcas]|uniref:EamA domain-containing protein n=1 Tax=Jatropha curcas TaxID=180498 RepID=A0A067KSF0_JATCU|nr:hypothetical protein JCGZ_04576 [Jatropha curcas]